MQEIFKYSDIDSIIEKPGCYCWYIDWTRIRKSDFENDQLKRENIINAIFKVYSPNPIFINATRKIYEKTQYFGETYFGTLKYDDSQKNSVISKISSDTNLFFTFLHFTNSLIIPLYIGKSKNLKRRIKQHVDYLEDTKSINNIDLDISDNEALKNFSERFGRILNECVTLELRTNMLSVKLVYLKEDEITEFESNLNYLYKPLFGLK